MEISGASSLLIKQIRDVNLTWVRSDLGSAHEMQQLRDSIEKNGLQHPLLLTTDMLVADGARRLVACEQLGYERIEVLVTSDWEVVTAYYAEARALARKGWPSIPMPWRGLVDLVGGTLKQLYHERYRIQRNQQLAKNRRIRASGGTVTRDQKHMYTEAAAKALGMKFGDLRTLREVYAALDKMAKPPRPDEVAADVAIRHKHVALLVDMLHESEREGGARLSGIQARVRLAMQGGDPTSIQVGSGRRKLSDPTYAQRVAKAAITEASGSELTAAMIVNVAKMLDELALTASYYTRVKPTMPVHEARNIAAEMRTSIQSINRMVKTIQAYGTSYLEEE